MINSFNVIDKKQYIQRSREGEKIKALLNSDSPIQNHLVIKFLNRVNTTIILNDLGDLKLMEPPFIILKNIFILIQSSAIFLSLKLKDYNQSRRECVLNSTKSTRREYFSFQYSIWFYSQQLLMRKDLFFYMINKLRVIKKFWKKS
ncbi:hypothetical protein pb186bvf_004919 [Paramecium bursaria]